MLGERIFVAIAFVVLGASFLASTGLLIYEFRSLDWLMMVAAHSHLFKEGELVGKISGVVFAGQSAGIAALRYEELNDWVVRLFGIGADQWVLEALIAIALGGIAALFLWGRIGMSGRPAASA
jgi:hypothetical protein